MMFERLWVMPNKYTFSMKPVQQLLAAEMYVAIARQRLAEVPFAANIIG